MILCAHGRFDSKDDPDSAMEIIAAECRTFHPRVKSIEWDGVIDQGDIEERNQKFAFVGYSNGGEQVLSIAAELAERTLIEIDLMILLDPALQSLWQQLFANRMGLPRNVKHCVTYIRQDRFKPEMVTWAPNQEVIPVAANHGGLPYQVGEEVVGRLRELFVGPQPPVEELRIA